MNRPILLRRLHHGLLLLAYLACLVFFLKGVARGWSPEHGWTRLIRFGSRFEDRSLDALKELPHAVLPDSHGYDGQFYAQLALNPTLDEPQLPRALDNVAYRSRRILFSWTAWALGLGRPAWIIQAYALQNVLFWFGTAILLWSWLPPISWFNLGRWAGILFSAGWLDSVGNALLDGPALFLLLLAIWLCQHGWRWSGAALAGLSLLGKETNLLAAPLLLDCQDLKQRWVSNLLRLALLMLPLLLWLGVIQLLFGLDGSGGKRNFAPPLVGWWAKIEPMRLDIQAAGWQRHHLLTLACVIGTLVQMTWMLARWDPSNFWWRLGLPYVLLGMCLGAAVTEGYPGAFTRVLLPLQAAFNLSLPHTRTGWLMLLPGNLSVLAAFA